MSTPALNPLVTKIRGAHPGAYDDMDDAALTKAVLAKYPQYSDMAAPPMSQAPGGPSSQPMPAPGALDRGLTAAGAATANMIPTRDSLSHMMNDKPAAGEGDNSLLPEAVNNAVNGTFNSTFAEPYQRAASGDIAGAMGQFVPNALALGATVKPLFKGMPNIPAGKIAQTVGAVAKPVGIAAEDLPVVGSVVKGAKALGNVRGEISNIWADKPTYPGAPEPATPPTELRQANALSRGVKPIEEPAAGLGSIPAKRSLPDAFNPPPPKPPPVPGTVDAPFRGGIAGKMAESVQQPAPKPEPFQRGTLQNLLNDSLDAAQPPERNKPIYQRGSIAQNMPTSESRAASDAAFKRAYPEEGMKDLSPVEKEHWQQNVFGQAPAEDIGAKARATNPEPTRAEVKGAAKPTPDATEGHTPHDSSALKSSKYDPGAKEFHARMTSGDTTYVYGDVAPEEHEAFSGADSKGKAYQQIKNGHPLVAKIVNGKRIAVKPSPQ